LKVKSGSLRYFLTHFSIMGEMRDFLAVKTKLTNLAANSPSGMQ
jgi:hypothetical protein